MAGFTPINVPISTRTAPAPSQLEGSRATSDQHQTRNVASEYLGRDEDLPAAPPPKKPSTKGKRLAVTAGDTVKTNKRRRSSNVNDGLHITKSRGGEEQLGKPSEDDRPAKSSKPKKKIAATKQPKKLAGAVSPDNAEADAPTTKPVSVYAPATSVDALDSTSVRTAVDSIRANAGQSFTLYQGPSFKSSFQSNVYFSQPLLSSSSKSSHIKPRATAEATQEAQNIDEFTYLSSDDDNPVAEDGPLSKQSKPTDRPNVTPDVAGSLKVRGDVSRRTTRPKKAVNYRVEQTFPDIEEVKDAQPEPSKQAATKARRRRSTMTLDDEDDFGELAEEDVAELADEVEKVVAERQPLTPPPRGRKQNMREVDEHEDYGGALLSNAERVLLGEYRSSNV